MRRPVLIWLLAAVLLGLGAWWLRANTEWVENDQARPARGEARDHPTYALEQLLRRLGMHVERRQELDRLPPEGARLVLLSNDWDVIPGRAEQLHQWVLHGGHLLLLEGAQWDETRLESWVPILAPERSRKDWAQATAAAASAASAANPDDDDDDDEIDRPQGAPGRPTPLHEHKTFNTCIAFNDRVQLMPRVGLDASWWIHYPSGVQALRVPQGQGSVTVLNTGPHTLYNQTALRCENPLLLADALQAKTGATVWIYLNEEREALLPWLWHRAWITIVLGLLALLTALWRGALRFGPRVAAAPRHRRSIGEQVRGTGAYLHRHGGEALLAAQLRALEESAQKHIPRYRQLPMSARAQAIAQATQLPPTRVLEALSTQASSSARLSARLQLLETARRLLEKVKNERSPS